MSTIEDKLTYLLGTKSAIRQAIRDKGVEVSDEDSFRSYAEKIGLISGGLPIISRKEADVIFYDYDGSIAYSYTKDEALALPTMPEQPQHDGLTRQGWNRTYEEMMEIINDCGFCSVEPLYIPNDGYTHLFISITAEGRQKYPLYITASVAGAISINWGDGSEDELFLDITVIDTYHFYETPGDYEIVIKTAEGTILFGTGTSTGSELLNPAYQNMLYKVYLGSNVSEIQPYSFYHNKALQYVTTHNAITSIGAYAFYACTSLVLLPLTDNCQLSGSYTFSFCWALKTIKIPNTQQTIESYSFQKCFALNNVYIPDSVTTIKSFAFAVCQKLKNVRLSNYLVSLGNSAFGASGVESFIPPLSLTTIESSCFAYSALRKVYISYRNSFSVADGVFNNCTELEEFVCDAISLTLSGASFYQCYKLREVRIKQIDSKLSGSYYYYSTGTALVRDINAYNIFGASTHGFLSNTNALKYIDIYTTNSALGDYAFQYAYALVGCTLRGNFSSITKQCFKDCLSLKYVDLSHKNAVVSLATTDAFTNCPSDYLIIVPDELVESYKAAINWASIADHIVGSYQPSVCTSLAITAEDVSAKATTTTIHYTAVTNGFDPRTGAYREGVVVTGTATSGDFGVNESYDNSVTHTITFTYMEVTATTTITQAAAIPAFYTVDLNSQWRLSPSIANPDDATYEGVYESHSNYNVNSANATMYIDIEGYSTFKLYIRSYAESSYDYVMVGALDATPTTSSNYANTKGAQNSGTAISNYKLVTFSNIDGGAHRITIIYRKDSSSHSGTDRGYVLIPLTQE